MRLWRHCHLFEWTMEGSPNCIFCYLHLFWWNCYLVERLYLRLRGEDVILALHPHFLYSNLSWLIAKLRCSRHTSDRCLRKDFQSFGLHNSHKCPSCFCSHMKRNLLNWTTCSCERFWSDGYSSSDDWRFPEFSILPYSLSKTPFLQSPPALLLNLWTESSHRICLTWVDIHEK